MIPKKTPGTTEAVPSAIPESNSANFTALQAAFAQQGHRLSQVTSPNGTSTYWAERWGLVRYLPTLHDVGRFLVQIGGRL